jgi:hypothetical protein
MIMALAGRRIDSVDAQQQRFPSDPKNLDIVKEQIRSTLQAYGAVALVSSAACGADLLALSEAGSLGLRRRIVLPFDRGKFRATSVTDHPGQWGSLYDTVLDDVAAKGDLLVLNLSPDDRSYAKANQVILDEALSLGQLLKQPVTAVLVWDGRSRGPGDLTEEFGLLARKKGFPIVEVMTL